MIPAEPPLEIRRYRASDREAVKALWAATLGHAVEVDRDLDFIVRWDNARLFVGCIAGAIVATAAAGHEGNRGWLHRVATHPAHRRKGHARRLIAHAEAWLASLDVPKVNLQIRGRQPEIQAFYERCGYVVEDRTSMGRRLVPIGAPLPTLEVAVTHLAMAAPPRLAAPPAPALKLAVLRADEITATFYRYLHAAVGGSWQWREGLREPDEALGAYLADEAVDVLVLYVSGEPAGFAELDRRKAPEVTLARFGLVPHFVGRGLGPWFLHWAIAAAWRRNPAVLRASTCTLDHPRALALYQRMGFVPVRQETTRIVHPGRAS